MACQSSFYILKIFFPIDKQISMTLSSMIKIVKKSVFFKSDAWFCLILSILLELEHLKNEKELKFNHMILEGSK